MARRIASNPAAPRCAFSVWGAALAVVVGLLLGSPASSWGQAPGREVAQDAATAAFDAGLAAVERGDWAEARRRFEEAYAADPHPRTLFNLAAAQVKTGALVEAMESYRQYLERSAPTEENAAPRASAGRLLEELAARVAHVRLELSGASPGDSARIDGAVWTRPGEEARLNPGEYELVVERAGRRVTAQRFRAEGGGNLVLRVAVPRERAARTAPVAAEGADDEGGVLSSWWFWTAVGAVVVAGTTTAVVLATSAETRTAAPSQGNLPGWSFAEVR